MSIESGVALLAKNLNRLTQVVFNSEEDFKKAIKAFEHACAGANELGCLFRGIVEKPLPNERKDLIIWIYCISIDVYALPPNSKCLITTITGTAYVEQAKGIPEIHPDDLKFLRSLGVL